MGLMIEDFRNADICKKLIKQIEKEATKDVYRFMEVCGSHTMAIAKFGIKSVLPSNIDLVSGPGCPVCVTPQCEIDALFEIAEKGAVIATFGDMMRVPGSKGQNLQKMKSEGCDVRIVFSPLDTLKIAKETDKEVVFVGIGFETTAPAVAGLAIMAEKAGVKNVSITPYNKTMPEVLSLIISDKNLQINGFVCPGHVTAVTGIGLYDPIVKEGMAAVITGFEPVDVLSSILEMVRQVNTEDFKAVNMYSRVVADEGNAKARDVINAVYEKQGCWWRGIGFIEESGLAFRKEYEQFDAFRKFDVTLEGDDEIAGCSCGEVLKGYIKPTECALFGTACTPQNPVGPCMVSSEGACAAAYKYGI
ncbi:hydrogenase formation HypD protein [Denitrovibrio acetiphilus DSM 12809]|uniref:Hydrogenase formation HypD protein n=1 Tax=Denitrovibrio acetiphilus (strain DSM 12809 / NBRC 114555 / N2460) TaxID=522772 RepID=D4H3D6_DENA2|nr:hydrogenase formation protein HypD [Denitrovibrio acetiphilus]ADD67220.1 hydrogenase formation HypD protein [Denitrovibrio acetiphilus DSM 12809]